MKKRKYLFGVLIGAILLLVFGCNMIRVYLSHDSKANEIVDTFAYGDIKEINSLVFGTNSLLDDEDEMTENQISTGILSQIFEIDEIQVKYTDILNKQIVYEITAPDLSDIFIPLLEGQETMTEEEFEQYVLEYIEEADSVTNTVKLPYIIEEDGVLEMDFDNPEFINAVTGGLLDAYKDVYQEAIREYLEELEGVE